MLRTDVAAIDHIEIKTLSLDARMRHRDVLRLVLQRIAYELLEQMCPRHLLVGTAVETFGHTSSRCHGLTRDG
ncbi:hypothetical protein HQO24_24450 [Rhodococcus fascians]|nr:hypothetical protein [Rhodococcus fascians]MBY4399639.1 hypothetical protein [Rhodococcus fascians]MBY4409445.1 hypothetical protein [Rhodococcus fascians]MBY4424228.1 hypothetical protein [Rhodococcus fascians]MBY4462940.1 hypothetical protein [Rhodococcus fascians]